MSRLTQLIRNSFIRLQGLFEQFFGFVKQLFLWLLRPLQITIKLMGLGESQYIEDVQPSKPFTAESNLPPSKPQAAPTTNSTRRLDPSMDYFRKLAAQVKTPK